MSYHLRSLGLLLLSLSCSDPGPKNMKEAVSVPIAQRKRQVPRSLDLVGVRWKHDPMSSVRKDLKRLSVNSKVSDFLKFEVLIKAYQSGEWAELFWGIEELRSSKSRSVLALLANFEGVLAWKEGRFQEAGDFFHGALKVDSKSEAALLNLAFLNLRFSYAEEAEALLLLLPESELSQSGLIASSYLRGRYSDADSRCQSLFKVKTDHKPSLFNCALVSWYGFGDKDRTIAYLSDFMKLPVVEKTWETEATTLLRLVKDMKPL